MSFSVNRFKLNHTRVAPLPPRPVKSPEQVRLEIKELELEKHLFTINFVITELSLLPEDAEETRVELLEMYNDAQHKIICIQGAIFCLEAALKIPESPLPPSPTPAVANDEGRSLFSSIADSEQS